MEALGQLLHMQPSCCSLNFVTHFSVVSAYDLSDMATGLFITSYHWSSFCRSSSL